MTRDILFDTKYLTIKALIASIIVHGIWLGLFTFTLQSQKESSKPVYIFLGSILSSYEVEINSRSKTGSLHILPASLLENIPLSSSQAQRALSDLEMNKPKTDPIWNQRKKPIFKPKATPLAPPYHPDDAFTHLEIPERQPLKLDNP